jgi:hypothetical protein
MEMIRNNHIEIFLQSFYTGKFSKYNGPLLPNYTSYIFVENELMKKLINA